MGLCSEVKISYSPYFIVAVSSELRQAPIDWERNKTNETWQREV